jgi:hypothetical protein
MSRRTRSTPGSSGRASQRTLTTDAPTSGPRGRRG